ncbi:hypothetical protein KQI61_06050 [Anaerocolumna aminovalerica]|uniref:hypothetical protein n=1 Tax=Anaerocolumna aminovalerica TaxID=1527 RepID=UPI001C0EED78|nr:hypothetical protein [Anaerocolumna aminovalerica]MBU5331753.1 hypothetical protein [Anaerocolumna aminovalerica]
MGQKMIWIDESLAAKLEIVNDVAKLKTDGDLDKVIKMLTDDTNNMSECLDENALRFKLHAQQTRDNYEKVVKEEVDKTYELWEKCEDLRDDARKKIDTFIPVFKSISSELDKLKQSMTDINLYKIEKLIELVYTFKQMSEEDKNMMAKLLDYSREK